MPDLVIVKHNGGNIRSVYYAFKRQGVDAVISEDPEVVAKADRIIFPGQGNASQVMNYLKQKGLDEVIRNYKNPLLGICVGLQVMCTSSEEGDIEGLNIFPYQVKKFPSLHSQNSFMKIPHMGWNDLCDCSGTLTKELSGEHLYYVHSYYAEIGKNTVANTAYINTFSAAIEKDNFFAFQAHLEKSGRAGERIIQQFLKL